MTDAYATLSTSLVSPASGAFAVTPDDSAELMQVTRALYVGIGGDLAVEMHWGGTVTFRDVGAGTLLPVRARRVLGATTAAAIVGLY